MWPYMHPHWPFLLLVTMIPIHRPGSMLPASIFGSALNHLTGRPGFPGLQTSAFLIDPPDGFSLVPWLGVVFLVVSMLNVAIDFARQIAMALLGGRTMRGLRTALFDRTASAVPRPLSGACAGHAPGQRRRVALGDVLRRVMMAADLFLMIFFASVLFYLNWSLALVAMAVVPALVVAAVIFRWKVRAAYRMVRVRIARINAQLQETITGMKVVPLFAREQRNLADFTRTNRAAPARCIRQHRSTTTRCYRRRSSWPGT